MNREKFGTNRDAYFGPSGLCASLVWLTRGDALRFASRLPLAVICRAFGAVTEY